jgi:hypothetical protein
MIGVYNHTMVKKTLITVAALLVMGFAFLGILDQRSETYTDNAFNRALITFGIARGINGVISVAQGTEVAVHPAGFGVNFAPGQILDPVNDVIEQFSWVMLASTASLGVQKIFLSISASLICSVLLAVLMAATVIFVWRPEISGPSVRIIVRKLLLVMIFVRFSIPIAAIGSEWLFNMFLQQQYSESTQKLQQTEDAISTLSKKDTGTGMASNNNEGMLDKAKKWLDSASQAMDIEARIEEYKVAAADATRQTVNLIVVFMIQTVIFPLLFLWIVYRFLKEFGSKLI